MLDTDQAEGLRRMVTPAQKRLIVVTGRSGSGKTCTALHLAMNLAQFGLRVRLLDEGVGSLSATSILGLRARGNLSDVLQGDSDLASVLLDGPAHLSVLPAAGAGTWYQSQIGRARTEAGERARSAFAGVDVLMVDGSGHGAPAWLDHPQFAKAVVCVLTPGFEAITETYALMKYCVREYRERRFQVMVNQAQSEFQARAVYESLASASRRFLDTVPGYLGFVRADHAGRTATGSMSRALFAGASAVASVSLPAMDLRRIARRLSGRDTLLTPLNATQASVVSMAAPPYSTDFTTHRPAHIRWASAGV